MSKQLPDTATCLGCGYSLRGLPSVICPECGRAFNPEDPTTYRASRVVSTWRWWARPPGIWHNAAILVVTLLMLYAWSGGAGWLGLGLLSCFLSLTIGPLLVVVYLVRFAATYADRSRADCDQAQHLRPKKWRWLVTPICLGLVISARLSGWPMQLRFAASQPAFEAQATRLLAQAGPSSPGFLQCNRYIGLYYVHYVLVHQDPPSVHFIVDSGPIEGWGFLYRPGQARQEDSRLPDGWDFCED